MEKIKIITLTIICLLFITGCTIKYNLNIDKDGITETLNILEYKNISDNEALDKLESMIGANTGEGGLIPEDYKIEKIIENNFYGVELFLQDYKSSSFIYNCYNDFNIKYDNNHYILQTGEKFSCFNMFNNNYDVQININVNGKVIKSNSDSHKGTTYTWNLKNGDNNQIYIEYFLDSKKKDMNLINVYIFIGLSVIIGGVIIYFVIKNKKSNEI